MHTAHQLLEVLGNHLTIRREAILQAWQRMVATDPAQTTAHSLTRAQFNDHIPEVLDAFEHRLRSRAGGPDARAADSERKREERKHGLHRWQQGYRLQELMREWGHLELCLFEEIRVFTAARPDFDGETIAEANRQLIMLVNEAVGSSAGQYERMERAEAAGHVNDLKGALAQVVELERRRSALIHQAVHDLGNNVHAVNLAAVLLADKKLAESERAEFATLLQQGMESVATMLGELMELARLEAGQEHREISEFDAAAMVTELCQMNQPVARERRLYLVAEGPPSMSVNGDPVKARRLLQNLVRNALKYTVHGGVAVSWGEERELWWLMVQDTGPGIMAGPGAPLVVGLKEATASARESDEKTAARAGEVSHVLQPSPEATEAKSPQHQQPGEGIGLSIVKRLCELLDASLEMESSAETGTRFRIVFPRHPAVANESAR